MVDPAALQMVLGVLTGWFERRERRAIAYLIEENRLLRRQLGNAYAERFVRSIKEECLDRIIPLGERHFRHVVAEFAEHYHGERNHQGLNNRLIAGTPVTDRTGRVRCRRRLGGLLNFYERAA